MNQFVVPNVTAPYLGALVERLEALRVVCADDALELPGSLQLVAALPCLVDHPPEEAALAARPGRAGLEVVIDRRPAPSRRPSDRPRRGERSACSRRSPVGL